MSRSFQAHLKMLPISQQELWPHLRGADDLGFVLYGGTAIALRLGHRSSVDFDLFSEGPLNHDAIKAAFDFVTGSTTIQDHDNTWTLLVPSVDLEREYVKVSFFGQISFGRVGEPEATDDGVLQLASIDDLMATRLKVILQRSEAKDYRDIVAMIKAGASLSQGLSAGQLFYGPNFQPSESLKALVYFDDGDLDSLTDPEKNILVDSVSAVRDLPQVRLLSSRLKA